MNESPDCTVCSRELWEDELGRYACKPCEGVIARTLNALRPLFHQASEQVALMKGSAPEHVGAASPGGSTAPLKIGVLSLTSKGGAVTTLQAIEDSWRTALRWSMGPTRHYTDIAGVTDFLAMNLRWACESYPSIAQDRETIGKLFGELNGAISGDRPPRRIPVTCPCGTVLRITLDTPGVRCGGCEAQYGHAEVLRLPMAERAAA
ncbi:hypothetical protein ABTX82_01635 [Streptomyces lavendulae]|uniref:hypothetical protein n=1 Tax=Streptomyces lavendulae TaxID=1914 RepID=UPI003326B418